MSATGYVPPTPINKSSGPPLLSLLFNAGLFGVLTVQVLLYSLAFPKDSVYVKILVYVVYVLEFVQTVIVVDAAFDLFVTNFMDPYIFDKIGLLWLVPPLTAIATMLVQCYYAFRLKILTKSLKVPIIVVALSIAQFGGGIGVGQHARIAKYYTLLNTPEMLIVEGIATGFWNVGSVICDLIIAVYMTYYLSRFDTRIKETKIILTKIIRLTIETGIVTTMIGIICFGLAMIPGNPMYYLVPMGIIGKVYANSMLVLLNSRMNLWTDDANTRGRGKGSTQLSTIAFHPVSANSSANSSTLPGTASSYTAGREEEEENVIMMVDMEKKGMIRTSIS